jgi:hypothetical protein
MMLRFGAVLPVVAAAGVSLVLACSSASSAPSPGRGDGGTDATPEASASDAAPDGAPSFDAGLPDGAVLPQGKQLVQSTSVTPWGTTADGYVTFLDTATKSYRVVPASGGSPTTIGAYTELLHSPPFTSGRVAGTWSNDAIASLTIWTAAHGVHAIGGDSISTSPGHIAFSDDGEHVLFLDHTTSNTADVTIEDTDGTNTKILLAKDDVSLLQVGFVGSYAVVARCAAGCAAPVLAQIIVFSGPGWSKQTTLTKTGGWLGTTFPDPTGTHLLYVDASGLQVADLASGSSVLVDPKAVSPVGFTADGSHVVYFGPGQSLMTAPASGPGGAGPTTLVANSGFVEVTALSPDGKWALAATTMGSGATPSDGPATDLELASLTAPGPVTSLVYDIVAETKGVPFTSDSSFALYYAANLSGDGGDFRAAPTAGGSPRTITSTLGAYQAAKDARVVYGDGVKAGGGGAGLGQADIRTLDLSTQAGPSLLVPQADLHFVLTPALDGLVYGWNVVPSAAAGIWVLPLQ